jgi:hypothetical protein
MLLAIFEKSETLPASAVAYLSCWNTSNQSYPHKLCCNLNEDILFTMSLKC